MATAKITLRALREAKPGTVLTDPALGGLLRYRVRNSGRIYAELRFKDAADRKWKSKPLDQVDIDAITYDIALADAEDRGDYDERGRPVLPARLFTADDVLEGVRARARAMQSQLRRGEDPHGKDTLGAIAERYLRDIKGERRPRTFAEIERHLMKDWRPLHGKRLKDVTRKDIADRLDVLKSEAGPVARNRARADLRAMFQWALQRDLVPANPVDGTGKVPETPRKRVLSDEEVREVWNATAGTSDHDRIIRLCLLTGQRKDRIGKLRWREVEPLERGRWSLAGTETKNSDPIVVPLSGMAVDILKEQRKAQEDAGGAEREFAFGRNGTGFSGWSRAEERLYERIARQRAERRLGRPLAKGEEPEAGDWLPHFTTHDLRRTMRTNLGRLKVPRDIRELAIGHRLKGVEGVYDLWTYEEEKAEALAEWAALLAWIVSPTERAEVPAAKVIPLRA
jgi:integrase